MNICMHSVVFVFVWLYGFARNRENIGNGRKTKLAKGCLAQKHIRCTNIKQLHICILHIHIYICIYMRCEYKYLYNRYLCKYVSLTIKVLTF